MKVVVVGGSGLVGSQVIELLRSQGHEAVPAEPEGRGETQTGAGGAAGEQGARALGR